MRDPVRQQPATARRTAARVSAVSAAETRVVLASRSSRSRAIDWRWLPITPARRASTSTNMTPDRTAMTAASRTVPRLRLDEQHAGRDQ